MPPGAVQMASNCDLEYRHVGKKNLQVRGFAGPAIGLRR